MTTTPNMLIDKPTLGGDAGAWDDKNNAAIDKIDAHDHSVGKGTTVKTNGISINADLTFSSLYAPINLHRITFASIVALTGNNKSLFVNTADNELYWRSNAGTNVKITSGSALNVAAFTGGIGGDYTSVAASVAFDDAGDRYTFKQNGGTGWARLACGDVRLFETGTSDAVFVGLAAPSALAASYTVTMPLAAPTAGTRPVQMSTAGVLTAGDSDNVQVGGTLGVTGLVTATAGVTAAANQHVTVSGTGAFKHGDQLLNIPGCYANATNTSISLTSVFGTITSTAATTLFIAIPLKAGDRIKSVAFDYSGDGAVDATGVEVSTRDGATLTSIGSSSITNAASGNNTLTIDVTDTTVTSTMNVFADVVINAANFQLIAVRVTYDRP